MSQKINISDDDIKAIIDPELERAKDWHRQLADERKKCRELYDMAPLGNEVEGFSQSVSSTVFETVEWLKPGFSDIFCHPDFFTVKMREAERGERIKEIVRYQLFDQQAGPKIIRDYLDNALKYHNGVFKTCFVEESDDVEEEYAQLSIEQAKQLEQQGATFAKYDEVQGVDPQTGQPVKWLENVKVVRKDVKFAGPKVMVVPPWEFFISPGATSIDGARLVAHCVPRTLHDIKVGERTGIYKKGSFAKLKDRAGEAREVSEYLDEKAEQYEQDGLTVDEFTTHSSQDDNHKAAVPNRKLNVWEIYTRLDIDGDGLLETVIVRMAEGEVLQIEENPYKRPPFRAGRAIEIAHRFEGRALPLVLEHDQKELTNLHRLFVDSAAEAAYPTAISGDQSFMQQWAERSIGDALFIQGNPSEKVTFAQAPGPNLVLTTAIEMREGIVERKSGVSRYNQGVDADSLNKTATGMSIISSAGAQRQKSMARVLGEAIADVIKDMIRINELFPPYIDDVDLQPEPGLFEGKFSIEIEVGVGPQDRMAQSQYLAQHQQWLVGFAIPAGAATKEHAIKCQAKIGKLQGVPFDDLMLSGDEVQPVQEMQQQIQQMGAQLQQMQEGMQKVQQDAGNQIGKLTQENQKLQMMAKNNGPEAELAKLRADMEIERAKLMAEMQMKREELEVKREELAVDAQVQREKMTLDAQLKAAQMQQSAQSATMKEKPLPIGPTRKQIGVVRGENGMIVGAEVVEQGEMGTIRKQIDIKRDGNGLIVGAEVQEAPGGAR
ncbi:MAG: hypothetical protein RBR38_10405 [Desulfomicrobium apsheronum]|nr:hypothetical protein [Desulfomicrobium apsheronum]